MAFDHCKITITPCFDARKELSIVTRNFWIIIHQNIQPVALGTLVP
jgi:hypothetical protein